jgi:hypothetical protein
MIMAARVKVREIRIATRLPVKDVAFIFRDNIVKADRPLFRILEFPNKPQWEFRTPEKSTDAFDSLREPADPEPTFQVIARIVPRPRGSLTLQQAVTIDSQVEFFLKVWDHGTNRHVMVGAEDTLFNRSYVGNFINHLRTADQEMQVIETSNVV